MTSLTAAMQLGIEAVTHCNPIELRPNYTQDDVNSVVWAAYRQIFGNDHILLSERLNSAESLLSNGHISVRDFVRALAYSELYRQKFFTSTPQVRFIELNFKHFLGRAPYDESEITDHVNLYINHGYEAEIDSYLDSQEYLNNFGDSIVPYCRGFETQTSQKTVGFNRMFQLYRGAANSDRAQGNDKKGALTRELAQNISNPVQGPSFGKALTGNSGGDRNQLYKLRVTQGASAGSPQIRLSVDEYTVAYAQLSPVLQRLNKRGSKVLSITRV
jgi:phycocyanin-associated rod linker protein